ncbi:MAG TPA: hypothetical protein VD968_06785 [Pyrinomonadaceae bacterium]|nr:hypothetical protein [Pyrinomonadaceae bacterium]
MRVLIINRVLAKALPVVLILLGPFAVGALQLLSLWGVALAAAAAVALFAFASGSLRAKKATLVLASAALAVTASDLGLRLLPLVPNDMIERWPRLPIIFRYVPDAHFEGYRFNDLSRMAGVIEWREYKRVRLVTDSEGFRNERADAARPLDVIVLGDSFGAGAVSQEHTWSNILASKYGLSTYNLSTPASGPWQQYVNLLAEKDRLSAGEGTLLVWQLFTGNDLEDYYGPLEPGEIPWCGPLAAWVNRANSFRGRSPVRFLLQRREPSRDVIPLDFINGRKLLFYRPYVEAAPRTAEQVVGHVSYERFRATVGAVKGLADAQRLRLAVVLVPSKEEVYEWAWRGATPWSTRPEPSGFAVALARVCEEEGIPLLDLKPHMVRESRRAFEESGQLFYWYDDTHMSTAGNVLSASVIHDALILGRVRPAE